MSARANELDVDAIEARANAATDGPWQHDGNDGLVWPQRIGDPVSGSNEMADADFIAAARTDVPALIAEVRQLRIDHTPVRFPSGEQLYVHRCNNVEWWHELTQGPINDQGCDGCEAGPDGGWRPVYFHESGDGR